MSTKKVVTGLKSKASIAGNTRAVNRDRSGLRVKAGLKGGKLTANHTVGVRVRAGLKAGKLTANHNTRLRA